jgi:hypothetical protein
MGTFDVLVAPATTPVELALAQMIEKKTPGLMIEEQSGAYRLIHFSSLAYMGDAARRASFKETLYMAPFERVVDPKNPDSFAAAAQVSALGFRFGLLNQSPGCAKLVSVQEDFAVAFNTGNKLGQRCTRPARPAGKPMHEWYHYYPPTPNEHLCSVDDSPIQ